MDIIRLLFLFSFLYVVAVIVAVVNSFLFLTGLVSLFDLELFSSCANGIFLLLYCFLFFFFFFFFIKFPPPTTIVYYFWVLEISLFLFFQYVDIDHPVFGL